MSEDRFAHDDAAYVLGALGPAERRAFEEHLAQCAECTRRVRDIAGLPGLLGTLDAADFADPAPVPVPDTLLPGLLREVRRRRRRSRLVLAVSAAAAAVLAIAFAVSVVLDGPAGGEAAAPVPTRTMTQVDQQRVTAAVSLQEVGWGTRIRLSCTYADGDWSKDPDRATPAYGLVVRTRDGRSEEVATWKVVPGRTARLEAATAADPADISAVDVVVSGSGRVLLTLPVGT